MNTHAFEKKLHSLKARFGLQLFVLAAVVCTSWIVTDHANAVYIPTGPEDAAIVLNEEEVREGEMSSQLKRYRVTNVEVNDISREVGAMMDNIGAISLTKGITFDVEGTPGDTTLVCVVTPRDSALPVDRETLIRWLRIRTKVENVKLFVEP